MIHRMMKVSSFGSRSLLSRPRPEHLVAAPHFRPCHSISCPREGPVTSSGRGRDDSESRLLKPAGNPVPSSSCRAQPLNGTRVAQTPQGQKVSPVPDHGRAIHGTRSQLTSRCPWPRQEQSSRPNHEIKGQLRLVGKSPMVSSPPLDERFVIPELLNT